MLQVGDARQEQAFAGSAEAASSRVESSTGREEQAFERVLADSRIAPEFDFMKFKVKYNRFRA